MNAVTAPSVLREKWGTEVVERLADWMKEIVRSEGVSRDEVREILSRLDRLEQGQEGLKEEVYRLRGEMNGFRSEVNERFDRMNEQFNQRLDAMNARMLSMIKWTVGTIALFGTIISVLMAVFKFVK